MLTANHGDSKYSNPSNLHYVQNTIKSHQSLIYGCGESKNSGQTIGVGLCAGFFKFKEDLLDINVDCLSEDAHLVSPLWKRTTITTFSVLFIMVRGAHLLNRIRGVGVIVHDYYLLPAFLLIMYDKRFFLIPPCSDVHPKWTVRLQPTTLPRLSAVCSLSLHSLN